MGDWKESVAKIWTAPDRLPRGAWLWWFWLFFIHGSGTTKTGKCRQIMILWSVKNDPDISCNGMDIRVARQITREDGKYLLDGAAAAWYFDGERMREDFVLERSLMNLDPSSLSLVAPGKTPSSFCLEDEEFVTKIDSGGIKFAFRARQTDRNAAIGPTYGRTKLPFGMEIEGTRIEALELFGEETDAEGKAQKIAGTAYFQKILLAAPPPQWYWGLYHFQDGSFFTYMLPYVGKATFADNLWKGASLSSPHLPANQDIMLYHAPTRRLFEGKRLSVVPRKTATEGCWLHEITGGGKGFAITAQAEGYSHACWKFEKKIGVLPPKSKFLYNEYPAVVKKLVAKLDSGEEIVLQNAWGNMENAWGFLI